jgi:hypothetical protein
VAERLVAEWPDAALPELLGKTPREAVKDPEGARRVEAIISVGEATAGRQAIAEAWTAIRGRVGLAIPATIVSTRPLQEVPPLRWQRLDMQALGMLIVQYCESRADFKDSQQADAHVSRARWEFLGEKEADWKKLCRQLLLKGLDVLGRRAVLAQREDHLAVHCRRRRVVLGGDGLLVHAVLFKVRDELAVAAQAHGADLAVLPRAARVPRAAAPVQCTG